MNDLISRKAAIDAVGNMLRRKFGIGGDLAEITLAGLPSAETDLSDYSDRLWKNAYERGKAEGARMPSAEPEIIRCKDCKHWTQSTGKMKGYGLGRCDFHDADLVTCNGFCYWAERRTDE